MDRQDKFSEHSYRDDKFEGLFKYEFHIGTKPVVGEWTIAAYGGLQTKNGIKVREKQVVGVVVVVVVVVVVIVVSVVVGAAVVIVVVVVEE